MTIKFPDNIRKEVRLKSANNCCICHQRVIQRFHHLIPVEEGGEPSLENCVPLCATCHSFIHGGGLNRSQVQVSQDTWYEWVKHMKPPDVIEEDLEITEKIYASGDVKKVQIIGEYIDNLKVKIAVPEANMGDIRNAVSHVSTAMDAYITSSEIDTFSNYPCPRCENIIDVIVFDEGPVNCPNCGLRLY